MNFMPFGTHCGTDHKRMRPSRNSGRGVHTEGYDSIELPQVILHILAGAAERPRRLHLQGDQGGGEPEGGGNVAGQPFVDVAGKGGIAPGPVRPDRFRALMGQV